MPAAGYMPVCPWGTDMRSHEIIEQQITILRDMIKRLEVLKENIVLISIDEAEELWDDIDVETLKNAQNFGDFYEIVKRISSYYNIGK